MFSAPLGLAIAELSDGLQSKAVVIGKVKCIAIGSADAYVAREELTSPAAALITRQTRAMLRSMVSEAGLGHPLPTAQLTSFAATAVAALSASLALARTPATGNESLPETQPQ
jgi:hypothetical protein